MLIEKGWALKKMETNAGCAEVALMTSKLRHNFKTSLAACGADDIPTPHFYSLIIFMSVGGHQVLAHIYCSKLESLTLFY